LRARAQEGPLASRLQTLDAPSFNRTHTWAAHDDVALEEIEHFDGERKTRVGC
jgi:hypothetical protein